MPTGTPGTHQNPVRNGGPFGIPRPAIDTLRVARNSFQELVTLGRKDPSLVADGRRPGWCGGGVRRRGLVSIRIIRS